MTLSKMPNCLILRIGTSQQSLSCAFDLCKVETVRKRVKLGKNCFLSFDAVACRKGFHQANTKSKYLLIYVNFLRVFSCRFTQM